MSNKKFSFSAKAACFLAGFAAGLLFSLRKGIHVDISLGEKSGSFRAGAGSFVKAGKENT